MMETWRGTPLCTCTYYTSAKRKCHTKKKTGTSKLEGESNPENVQLVEGQNRKCTFIVGPPHALHHIMGLRLFTIE